MTEAAGPESMVSTGRFFISAISITPPSPLIIINGTCTPASLTDPSVEFAVSNILGRILALMAAVLVLLVKPYNFVISDAIVVGICFFDAISYTNFSGPASSTPNAIDDTITCAPLETMSSMAIFTESSVIFFVLIKQFNIWISLLFPRSILDIWVCFFARNPSNPPFAIPTIPTLATSPSIKAFVA